MMIDRSFSAQYESNTRLGTTITFASYVDDSDDSDTDPSNSDGWCMYCSISRAEGPVGTSRFRKTEASSRVR